MDYINIFQLLANDPKDPCNPITDKLKQYDYIIFKSKIDGVMYGEKISNSSQRPGSHSNSTIIHNVSLHSHVSTDVSDCNNCISFNLFNIKDDKVYDLVGPLSDGGFSIYDLLSTLVSYSNHLVSSIVVLSGSEFNKWITDNHQEVASKLILTRCGG